MKGLGVLKKVKANKKIYDWNMNKKFRLIFKEKKFLAGPELRDLLLLPAFYSLPTQLGPGITT